MRPAVGGRRGPSGAGEALPCPGQRWAHSQRAVVEVAEEGRVGEGRLHAQEREPVGDLARPLHGAQLVESRVHVSPKDAGEAGLPEEPS